MAAEFIYILRPTRIGMVSEGATPQEAEIVGRHFQHLQREVAEGNVLIAGRTTTGDADTFGIVVFKAEDNEAAERFARTDPAVAEGVMSVQVLPFRVALLASEWNVR